MSASAKRLTLAVKRASVFRRGTKHDADKTQIPAAATVSSAMIPPPSSIPSPSNPQKDSPPLAKKEGDFFFQNVSNAVAIPKEIVEEQQSQRPVSHVYNAATPPSSHPFPSNPRNESPRAKIDDHEKDTEAGHSVHDSLLALKQEETQLQRRIRELQREVDSLKGSEAKAAALRKEMAYLENFMWEWLGDVEDEPDKVVLNLVKEFLHFYGYNNSVECIDAETSSMSAYSAHRRVSSSMGRKDGTRRDLCSNADIVTLLMRLFDAGCAVEFVDLWQRYVVFVDDKEGGGKHVDQSSAALKALFCAHLHFAMVPIRIFHAMTWEGEKTQDKIGEKDRKLMRDAMSRFESFLKHDGAILSQDPTFAPYFSIPFVRPPHIALPRIEQFNAIFESPPSSKFFDGGMAPDTQVPMPPNKWVRGIRENLENFLINTISQMAVPRLLRIYYCFKSDHFLAREKMTQLSMSNQKLARVCNSLFTTSVQVLGQVGQNIGDGKGNANVALENMKSELIKCGQTIKFMTLHKEEMLYDPEGVGGGVKGMIEKRKMVLLDHMKVENDLNAAASHPHFTSWWAKGCIPDWVKIRVQLQTVPSFSPPRGELWRIDLLGGLLFGILKSPLLFQTKKQISNLTQLYAKEARVLLSKVQECVTADIFARQKQTEGRKDVLQTLLLGKASLQWLLPLDDEIPPTSVAVGQMGWSEGFEGRSQRLLTLALMDCMASFKSGRHYLLQSGQVVSLLWQVLNIEGQFLQCKDSRSNVSHLLQNGLLTDNILGLSHDDKAGTMLAFMQETGNIFSLLQKLSRSHPEVRAWLIAKGAVQWLSLWLNTSFVAQQENEGKTKLSVDDEVERLLAQVQEYTLTFASALLLTLTHQSDAQVYNVLWSFHRHDDANHPAVNLFKELQGKPSAFRLFSKLHTWSPTDWLTSTASESIKMNMLVPRPRGTSNDPYSTIEILAQAIHTSVSQMKTALSKPSKKKSSEWRVPALHHMVASLFLLLRHMVNLHTWLGRNNLT
jgi:hypothetical protein